MKTNRKRLRKLLSQPTLNASDLSQELANGGLHPVFFLLEKDGRLFHRVNGKASDREFLPQEQPNDYCIFI